MDQVTVELLVVVSLLFIISYKARGTFIGHFYLSSITLSGLYIKWIPFREKEEGYLTGIL